MRRYRIEIFIIGEEDFQAFADKVKADFHASQTYEDSKYYNHTSLKIEDLTDHPELDTPVIESKKACEMYRKMCKLEPGKTVITSEWIQKHGRPI